MQLFWMLKLEFVIFQEANMVRTSLLRIVSLYPNFFLVCIRYYAQNNTVPAQISYAHPSGQQQQTPTPVLVHKIERQSISRSNPTFSVPSIDSSRSFGRLTEPEGSPNTSGLSFAQQLYASAITSRNVASRTDVPSAADSIPLAAISTPPPTDLVSHSTRAPSSTEPNNRSFTSPIMDLQQTSARALPEIPRGAQTSYPAPYASSVKPGHETSEHRSPHAVRHATRSPSWLSATFSDAQLPSASISRMTSPASILTVAQGKHTNADATPFQYNSIVARESTESRQATQSPGSISTRGNSVSPPYSISDPDLQPLSRNSPSLQRAPTLPVYELLPPAVNDVEPLVNRDPGDSYAQSYSVSPPPLLKRSSPPQSSQSPISSTPHAPSPAPDPPNSAMAYTGFYRTQSYQHRNPSPAHEHHRSTTFPGGSGGAYPSTTSQSETLLISRPPPPRHPGTETHRKGVSYSRIPRTPTSMYSPTTPSTTSYSPSNMFYSPPIALYPSPPSSHPTFSSATTNNSQPMTPPTSYPVTPTFPQQSVSSPDSYPSPPVSPNYNIVPLSAHLRPQSTGGTRSLSANPGSSNRGPGSNVMLGLAGGAVGLVGGAVLNNVLGGGGGILNEILGGGNSGDVISGLANTLSGLTTNDGTFDNDGMANQFTGSGVGDGSGGGDLLAQLQGLVDQTTQEQSDAGNDYNNSPDQPDYMAQYQQSMNQHQQIVSAQTSSQQNNQQNLQDSLQQMYKIQQQQQHATQDAFNQALHEQQQLQQQVQAIQHTHTQSLPQLPQVQHPSQAGTIYSVGAVGGVPLPSTPLNAPAPVQAHNPPQRPPAYHPFATAHHSPTTYNHPPSTYHTPTAYNPHSIHRPPVSPQMQTPGHNPSRFSLSKMEGYLKTAAAVGNAVNNVMNATGLNNNDNNSSNSGYTGY